MRNSVNGCKCSCHNHAFGNATFIIRIRVTRLTSERRKNRPRIFPRMFGICPDNTPRVWLNDFLTRLLRRVLHEHATVMWHCMVAFHMGPRKVASDEFHTRIVSRVSLYTTLSHNTARNDSAKFNFQSSNETT